MRIVQGFNSYTYETCINDVVIVDDEKPGGDHFADNNQISQMVTHCTKYVDKEGEVTDAMSLSAALSIKTASAGDSLSGSYVDADRFKESDINSFVQVKDTKLVNGITVSTDMLNSKYLGHGISGGTNVEYLKTTAPKEGLSLKGVWAQACSAIDHLGVFWDEDEKK
ncbi:hypothetical protein F5Y19DRAFT_482243 [Xylariaceae sp. FL1651]|nr:hypothetical protein F5Y19DRAFT_482243 [Xylariaceae sp. FL1651]